MSRTIVVSTLAFVFSLAACARTPVSSRVELTSAKPAEPPRRATIHLRELDVPTPHALPHDPAWAVDGGLWFTEYDANKIGRLDPTTGTFREIAVKRPDSGPHGLVVDDYGNVWFTAEKKAYIGKLEPSTGKILEVPLPDATVDPHTPVFALDGTLWFTAQNANDIGRLLPWTERIDLVPVPTPDAKPYGIVIGPDQAPWFCELGANKIGRIDPRTLEIRERRLPIDARPRRLALAPDGALFYSDYARGKIGRLDTQNGATAEWASPGGADSKPYAIAVTRDGHVWYSESGVTPNTLVRFDPKTAQFDVIAIPSGGGVVRNMVATPNGRLYLAESGVNKVAIATFE